MPTGFNRKLHCGSVQILHFWGPMLPCGWAFRTSKREGRCSLVAPRVYQLSTISEQAEH